MKESWILRALHHLLQDKIMEELIKELAKLQVIAIYVVMVVEK